MPEYILMRVGEPGRPVFVAPAGSEKSYTTRDKARVFSSLEEAEADRCLGNEVPVRLSRWPL